MRIAILDDDPAQLQLACDVLTRAGHRCHLFRTGRDLTGAMRREGWDLVILEWSVGDMPGEDVLRWIRSHGHADLPVLFMTARAAPEDVVHALNAGADDYLVKPAAPEVLVARVSALLRRAGVPAASTLEYGEFLFDLREERAYRCGEHVPLSRKQFQVAVLLFQNIARPLSRAHLFESVWKQSATDLSTRTVDTHVWAVRARLRLRPENGYLVAPVFGYGYRLEDLGGTGKAVGEPGGEGYGNERQQALAMEES
ncbi:Response regulator (plasmid) [Paraburkholderia kururiensis]|uniref:response regulator transcription factor n=1 Tax=Paraburkholderia kururiensis TaxID=984307 RepID=UPI0039A6FD96